MAYEPQDLGQHEVYASYSRNAQPRVTVGVPVMTYLGLGTGDTLHVYRHPDKSKAVVLTTPAYARWLRKDHHLATYQVTTDSSNYVRSRVAGPVTSHLGVEAGDYVTVEYGGRGGYCIMTTQD